MQPNYLYNATVTSVVDGDTVDATVDLGFYTQATIRFRLNGLDTPETNSPDPAERERAMLAKRFTSDHLFGKTVMIRSHKSDKYGRWLADIYTDEGNISHNAHLINHGLAKPYFGGKR